MERKKQCMGCMEFYSADQDTCPHCGYIDGKENSHVLHIVPGTLLHKRYVVGKALGYGSFGVTYLGWDRLLKHKVAIKEYLPSEYATRMLQASDLIVPDVESQRKKYEKGKKKFRSEAEKLAKLGHVDGVVYVYDTFEENHTAYIVMEYLEGETLERYLERKGILTEEETMDLMLPVLQVLASVHEHGIIHRDISPDNIFISVDSAGNRKVKLIDFGAARFAASSHSKSLTVLLRPGYSPEEQYRSTGEQGPHTDVYAIAAVMYQMVTGVRPPDALERRTAIERKKRDLLKEPGQYNRNLSENFETALLNALNVKLEDRTPTAEALLGELISFEKVRRRGSSIKRIDFMRWPLWAKIGVPAAGAAALAVLIGVSLWVAGLVGPVEDIVLPEGYTRVTDFVGATLSEAEELGETAALVINQADAEYSPSMAAGLVMRQDVTAGYVVLENSIVNLTVSTGIETYILPDVLGMNLDDALDALECMGLEVVTEEAAREGLAAGCVIAQNMAPYSEVNYGETVVLTVASAGETAAGVAPSLQGLTYEAALQEAANGGLTVAVCEKVFSKDCTEATVVDQSVQAGDPVEAGVPIAITVALPWREFTMPNLMYKSKAAAVQLLKNMGISAEVTEEISEVVARGMVFAQSVEKDAVVQPNDAVALTVSKGSTPFAMPDVEGKTEEEARSILTDSKLAICVEYGYDEHVAEGCVISQSIAGGDEVTRGTAVTITVCSMDGLVSVENVVGLTVDAATEKLTAQGLTIQTNEVYSATVEKGVILEQLPAAGSVQKEGTTVILAVSKGVDPATAVSNPENNNNTGGANASRSWRWSEWSATPPSGTSEYETKTQYRSCTRETTTSSESKLPGWDLYDTVSSWGDYGPWSDWGPDEIASSDSTWVDSKKQYRFRDQTSSTSTSYGEWSDWQDDPITASDSLQVETQEVQIGTRYYLEHWCTSDYCGPNVEEVGRYVTWPYQRSEDNINTHHVLGWYDSLSDFVLQDGTYAGCKDYIYYPNGNMYRCETTCYRWYLTQTQEITKTQYRSRTVTTTTEYDWGEWSPWTDSSYSASSTRQVEDRIVYRSCTRSQSTTYYYERWGEWSAYSDTPVSATSDVNVQTRTLYHYKIYD